MRYLKYFATLFLFIFTVFSYFNVYADSKVKLMTLNDFLLTANSDITLLNHLELEAYLKTAPKTTPYFDRIEIRTQTEEFDYQKQHHALRFYPKGFGETECHRLLAEKMKKALIIERKACYNAALKTRYLLILDYFKTNALIQVKKQLLSVYSDRINVLNQNGVNGIHFDVNALIVAEEMHTDKRLDLVELENKLSSVLHQITVAALGPGEANPQIIIDNSGLLDVQQIEKILINMPQDASIENVSLQDRHSKIEIAKIEHDLEIAKARDYIKMIELSYDMDERQDFNQAFTFEIGFKMPGVHADRERLNSRKLKYLQAKLRYAEEKRETREKVRSLSRSLKRLIQQYKILYDRKENSNADISFKTYMGIEGADPCDLLRLKESILKSELQLNKVAYMIRSKYIDLMDRSGMLGALPFKNYLSSNIDLKALEKRE